MLTLQGRSQAALRPARPRHRSWNNRVWSLATTVAAATFALTIGSFAASEVPQTEEIVYEPLAPLASHAKTSVSIVNELRNNHYYPRRKIDDSVSAQVFDKYLDRLDSDRAYFLAEDVRALDEKYRFSLDEALRQGDLEPAFDIFNLFQERMIDRLEYVLALVTMAWTLSISLWTNRSRSTVRTRHGQGPATKSTLCGASASRPGRWRCY